MKLIQKNQSKLIWSPRSNTDLYGNTAQAVMMDLAGVTIALGTDWIPSGSMNELRELKCADSWNQTYFDKHFTDADLWRMATINGAFAVGANESIGMLKVGYLADIAVFDGSTSKDFRAVIDAGVEDVALVMRGGTALYGDTPRSSTTRPSARPNRGHASRFRTARAARTRPSASTSASRRSPI